MTTSLLINGIVLGSVYLMFSTGFTLVFGSFGVINLAHGAVMTLGAFIGIWTNNSLGLPLPLTILVAALGAGVVNALMDAAILRPIAKKTQSLSQSVEELTPIIATLAVGAIVTGLLVRQVRAVDYTFREMGGLARPLTTTLRVSVLDLITIAGALLIGLALYLVISHTRAGMSIRAVAEDPLMASALGIRPALVSFTTFFVSGAMAGLTGVLVGILFSNVNVAMGEPLLLLAFVIVTVGGLGSLLGTAVASFLIALVHEFATNYADVATVNLIIFGLLFVVLLAKPAGMFGKDVMRQGVARQ